jgi:hypothetical protein
MLAVFPRLTSPVRFNSLQPTDKLPGICVSKRTRRRSDCDYSPLTSISLPWLGEVSFCTSQPCGDVFHDDVGAGQGGVCAEIEVRRQVDDLSCHELTLDQTVPRDDVVLRPHAAGIFEVYDAVMEFGAGVLGKVGGHE